MNVFELRRKVVDDYSAYVRSFISIRDTPIKERVERDLEEGLLWPQARIGLNPAFAEGAWVEDLVARKSEPGLNARRMASLRAGCSAPHGVDAGTREGAC